MATRKTILGFAIAAVVILMVAWAVERVAGATEDVSPVPWTIVVSVESKDGDVIKLTYGTQGSGPVFYKTKEVCEDAKKTDDNLATAVAGVLAVAAKRGDTVKSVDCVQFGGGVSI